MAVAAPARARPQRAPARAPAARPRRAPVRRTRARRPAARGGQRRLDRPHRRAPRRDRRRERRGPSPQSRVAAARAAEGRAPHRERRRRRPSSRASRPRPRIESVGSARARPRACRADRVDYVARPPRPVTTRVVNRRVRLLVAVFALAFGVVLVRAGWLQAVRAGSLDRARREPAPRDDRRSPPIAGRSTTAPGSSSRSASARSRSTRTRSRSTTRAPSRLAAGRALEIEPGDAAPAPRPTARGASSTSRARRIRAKAEELRDARARRARVLSGGAPHVPAAAASRPRWSATPASTTRAWPGSSSPSTGRSAGQNGEKTIVRDPVGHELDVVDEQDARERLATSTSRSTTRSSARSSGVLHETRERWNAVATTAVVLDPRTGGILAMAVEPGFDANRFPHVSRDRQRNRAVTDTYEPGSTFKVVTVGAALETGQVQPTTRYTLAVHDRGRGSRRSTTRCRAGPQTMTVSQIVSRSSNVGVVTLALGLGRVDAERVDRAGSASARRRASSTRARAPGSSCRRSSGRARRSGTCRSGTGSRSRRSRWRARSRRSRTAAWPSQPHLVERVVGGKVAEPKQRRIISTRRRRRR